MQKYISAETSVNTVKVPALFTDKRFLGSLHAFDDLDAFSIIDYGCGKSSAINPDKTTAELFLEREFNNVVYEGYDLTWRPDTQVLTRLHTVATCCNVLNVIAEREVRESIYNTLSHNAKVCYFYIYNSHKAGPTRCGYQVAEPAKFYASEMKDFFSFITVQGNMIIAKEEP